MTCHLESHRFGTSWCHGPRQPMYYPYFTIIIHEKQYRSLNWKPHLSAEHKEHKSTILSLRAALTSCAIFTKLPIENQYENTGNHVELEAAPFARTQETIRRHDLRWRWAQSGDTTEACLCPSRRGSMGSQTKHTQHHIAVSEEISHCPYSSINFTILTNFTLFHPKHEIFVACIYSRGLAKIKQTAQTFMRSLHTKRCGVAIFAVYVQKGKTQRKKSVKYTQNVWRFLCHLWDEIKHGFRILAKRFDLCEKVREHVTLAMY